MTEFKSSKRIVGTSSERTALTTNPDTLGTSANGTNSGISNPNYSSNGLEFTGGEYVEVNGLRSTINSATSLSMACWINPSDITDATILGYWNTGEIMLFSINGSNKLNLSIKDGSNNRYFASSASISANTLTHVAFTYDTSGTNTVKLYINGALDSTHTTNVPSSLGSSSTENIYIGAHSLPTNYFTGTMKQFLVYSDVLTLSEIQTLYNSGTPVTNPSTSGLVSRYDLTANANDSQGSNNGTSSAIKLGLGAYSFDGSNDTVNLGNDLDTILTGDFSFATWAYMPNATSSSNKTIICKPATTSWANPYHSFTIQHTGGNIDFQTNNGSTNVNIDLACGQGWHHIAVTKSGTTFTLYIDGTTSESQTIANTAWGTQDWIIGNTPYNSRYFDGDVDDMAFWSRALTATEISDLVNATLPSTATDSFNFSSSTGWSTSGQSDSEVDTSAGNLKYKGTGDSNDHRVSYDLTSVSDKKWKVRFIWNPTTTASSDGCGGSYYFYGLSDSTGAKTTSQDFIGIGMIGGDNLILTRSNGQSLQDGALGGGDLITGFSTGTTYYVTIERTSNDTITATVRTGSHTGTVAGTSRTYTDSSVEGITGLRYFKGCGYGSGSNVCGTTNQNIGTIDDLEIFNASDDGALVSSLSDTSGLKAYYSMDTNNSNTCPNDAVKVNPNIQTNSIWNESNTGKHYIIDSDGNWTEVA